MWIINSCFLILCCSFNPSSSVSSHRSWTISLPHQLFTCHCVKVGWPRSFLNITTIMSLWILPLSTDYDAYLINCRLVHLLINWHECAWVCMSTAIVERSFSSINRVMTVERTGQTNNHLDETIFISIEGQPFQIHGKRLQQNVTIMLHMCTSNG